jgi:DNA-binding IclR family transcriptional regulator
VAAALRLSASTALRLLRSLADDGTLEKSGGGRATRYHFAGST